MTLVKLLAWDEESLSVGLSREQAAAIEREGLAEVLAGASPGIWRLRTGSRVGVVLGEGWELRVMPRLAVPQLMFLLGYATNPSGWRNPVTGFERDTDLFSALANGFAWQATRALDRGVLRGYLAREERRVNPRGRVLFTRQAATGRGLPIPVEVGYDDFTTDVLENQLLKTAAHLVSRLPRLPPVTRRRLHRIRALLESVEPLQPWKNVKAPAPTRLNQHYSPALALAELILSLASVSERKGAIQSTTFVFDMNKVFEDFITVSFRDAMRSHGGVVRNQVKTFSLDEQNRLKLKPDLSWWNGNRCLVVNVAARAGPRPT